MSISAYIDAALVWVLLSPKAGAVAFVSILIFALLLSAGHQPLQRRGLIVVANALFPSSFSRGLAARPGCTSASEPVARRFSSDRASSAKTHARSASSSMREVSEKAVRHSPVPRTTTVCSDRTDVAGRVNDFLRRKYPVKVGECVGADLGIKATTVQKWMERTSAPSSWMLVKMIRAYGPQFLAAVLGRSSWPQFLAAVLGESAPDWLDECKHNERREQIAAELRKMQAEIDAM